MQFLYKNIFIFKCRICQRLEPTSFLIRDFQDVKFAVERRLRGINYIIVNPTENERRFFKAVRLYQLESKEYFMICEIAHTTY